MPTHRLTYAVPTLAAVRLFSDHFHYEGKKINYFLMGLLHSSVKGQVRLEQDNAASGKRRASKAEEKQDPSFGAGELLCSAAHENSNLK